MTSICGCGIINFILYFNILPFDEVLYYPIIAIFYGCFIACIMNCILSFPFVWIKQNLNSNFIVEKYVLIIAIVK
jgi:hypothetical protein